MALAGDKKLSLLDGTESDVCLSACLHSGFSTVLQRLPVISAKEERDGGDGDGACGRFMNASSPSPPSTTGPYLYDVYTERGRGLPKCRCGKRGCMDLVLWIWPECRQGGGCQKSQKLCRRHLSMSPKTDSFKDKPAANASEVFISDPEQKEG